MANTLLLPSINSDDEGPNEDESSDDDEMDGQFQFGGILVSPSEWPVRTFSDSLLSSLIGGGGSSWTTI